MAARSKTIERASLLAELYVASHRHVTGNAENNFVVMDTELLNNGTVIGKGQLENSLFAEFDGQFIVAFA